MNILITGGNGFLGSELAVIAKKVYNDAVILTPTKEELDLLDYYAVSKYFDANNIDKVFHCAGRVSGMFGHNQGEDLYVNATVGLNVVKAASEHSVQSLVNVGSTCIYPKNCEAPVDESQLMQGDFEPTCSGMAFGKVAVIQYMNEACDDKKYITVMPPNIYGPGEPIKPYGNHCMLDIMLKVHNAKMNNEPVLQLPGTGKAVRSFMHVQDCANAIIWCEQHSYRKLLNIGSNISLSIKQLADTIKKVIGYRGEIQFIGTVAEDGHPNKTESVHALITEGYSTTNCIDIESGIKQLYNYVLLSC